MSNPILSFSARRRMRCVRTPLLITLYATLTGVVAYFAVYAPFMRAEIVLSDMRASVVGYAVMLVLQFGLLVLVAPAMTAGSISGERERQTLDLIMVTNTGAVSLVVGKLLESFGFLALLVLSTMPMLSLALLTGGATLWQVLQGVAFLLLIALAALSVGLFCSTLFRRTVTATVVSYITVFGLGISTLLPIWQDVQHIGRLYDAMNIAGQQLHMLDVTPVSFVINPALGLFSLLQTQTQLAGGYLWQFSHTLGNTCAYLPFEHFLYTNMLFLAAMSAALIALSALKMRSHREGKGRLKHE